MYGSERKLGGFAHSLISHVTCLANIKQEDKHDPQPDRRRFGADAPAEEFLRYE
jgi:hypothetical protein